MGNIIRVFRAVVKPGKVDEFREFFLGEAVANVRRREGLLAVQVGLPTDETPNEFLMVTTWSTLEDLVGFTGPNWREAVVVPQEAPLLVEATVQHYLQAPQVPAA